MSDVVKLSLSNIPQFGPDGSVCLFVVPLSQSVSQSVSLVSLLSLSL